MNTLISIIVPIYKSEFYIKKCVNSLIKQTYKNIEIILVDDGSPDNCPTICDEFGKKDKRIKVIHQKNSGVSTARNVGIDAANGKYIAFVDSDDWIPLNAMEVLYSGIVQNDTDLCYGAIKEINIFNDKILEIVPNKNIGMKDAFSLLEYIKKMFKTPVGKLFKRDLINDNNIRFDKDIKFHEDTIFLYRYLQKCDKLSSVSNVTYCYNRLIPDSASRKQYSEVHLWKYTAAYELEQIFKEQMSIDNVAKYVYERYLLPLNSMGYDIVASYNEKEASVNKLREVCQIFEEKLDSCSSFISTAEDEKLYKIFCLYNQYIKALDYDGLYEYLVRNRYQVQRSKIKDFCKEKFCFVKSFLIYKIFN